MILRWKYAYGVGILMHSFAIGGIWPGQYTARHGSKQDRTGGRGGGIGGPRSLGGGGDGLSSSPRGRASPFWGSLSRTSSGGCGRGFTARAVGSSSDVLR